MEEILLKYVGKKRPFKIPPMFRHEATFGNDPVWVPSMCALKLIEVNPAMFQKLQERDLENPVEFADEIKPKEELKEPEIESEVQGQFVCESCGKSYTVEHFYLKHISKCQGPDND